MARRIPKGIKQPHPLGSVASRSGISPLTVLDGGVTTSTGVKISELIAASAANSTDQIEVNQAGTSRRITVDQLLDVTGGAYLPMTGGTLAGPGNLAVGGTLGVTGATTLSAGLTGTSATFTGAFANVSTNGFEPQLVVWNQANDTSSPYLMMRKSRGASGAVSIGDTTGTVMFQATDTGGTLRAAASIGTTVSAVGAGSVTSGIRFYAGSTEALFLSSTAVSTSLPISGTSATFSGTVTAPGAQIQLVSTQTGAVATGTTVIPVDDTIPQITEGDQYMTLAITPRSATSKLIIDVKAQLYSSSAGTFSLCGALFQDATANALAAMSATASASLPTLLVSFTHTMTSGTTSATTFRFRAGSDTAGTTTFNGTAGTRKMGGVMASSIVIREVAT